MALIRVLPEDKIDWVLQRNPVSSKPAERIKEDRATSEYALKNEDFIGKSQNIFCYYNNYTSSLIDILNHFVFGDKRPFHKTIPDKYKIIRSKSLSYLSLDEIDSRGLQLALAAKAGTKGAVDLLKIVSHLKEKDGLNFDLFHELGTDEIYASALGSMDAKNNIIKISNSLEYNSPGWRFTLAHEIGHYIFHHEFMLKNKIDEHIDTDDNYSIVEFSMTSNLFRRLEWQANMFANSLLMPRSDVFCSIASLVVQLDIRNFNSGIIYVDNQQCNLHNYNYIVSKLKKEFHVSATIVEIRLKQLRILNDKRITPEKFNFNSLNIK